MGGELGFQRAMTVNAQRKHDYVGALIQAERRLVLVPMDPQEPWEAFRALRTWMRRKKLPAEVGMFESDAPIVAGDNVIPLARRRGA